MKPGTLVAHRKWGKGIVTEILTYEAFTPIRVCWLNTRTRDSPTSIVWQKQVTILSEPKQ
jgi:hypothetical protein